MIFLPLHGESHAPMDPFAFWPLDIYIYIDSRGAAFAWPFGHHAVQLSVLQSTF